jgi:hypothetical protein
MLCGKNRGKSGGWFFFGGTGAVLGVVVICRSCGNFHRRQGKRTDREDASAFGKNIGNVQMNRIVDIAECFLVGIVLRIAALQSRTRNKIAISVMLDDYREMIGFHWWQGRSVRKLLQVMRKSMQLLFLVKIYEYTGVGAAVSFSASAVSAGNAHVCQWTLNLFLSG